MPTPSPVTGTRPHHRARLGPGLRRDFEIKVGKGRVRILGGVLQFPTTGYYHPFGLSSYGVTDIGYTLLRNLWTWRNPNQNANPRLRDDRIRWVESAIPTRVRL